MTPLRAREIGSQLVRGLETLPAVVLTGLRQAGKTTFLQQAPMLAGRRYLTLDDFAVLEAAHTDPKALISGSEPITIDEVQRCPDLLVAIKREIDRERRPGRFLLSGSANLALMAGVSESLAGRALWLTMHPFSRRERLGQIDEPPFLVRFLAQPDLPAGSALPPIEPEEILRGGLPPVALGEAKYPEIWFRGYEQTYLGRDLRDLTQVADVLAVRQLARLAAMRSGQVLNQSDLARDARLSANVASRYLSLLETIFLVERLPPFLRSRVTRLIKSPKLLMTDSGLACYLASVKELAASADEPWRGAMVETFVAQNLRALLAAHLPEAELFFWSVQGRQEVDFVIALGARILGIEVKAASRFSSDDLRGLRAFLAQHSNAVAGVLAYNGSEALNLGDGLYAIPQALLLS